MRHLLALSILLVTAFLSYSQNAYQPRALETLNSSAVYSVCQDKVGAVWLNSSAGVFRYNGNVLEMVHSPLIMRQFAPGDNFIYAPTVRNMFRFDVKNVAYSVLPFPKELRFSNSSLATNGDSLYVSVGRQIYLWDGSSVILSHELEDDVSSLFFFHGKLLVGTRSGWLLSISENCAPVRIGCFQSQILQLGKTSDGRILVGLLEGGFSIIDPESNAVLLTEACHLQSVRSFSSSGNSIFIGSVSGAYRYDIPDGRLSPISLAGETSLPVCSVFLDSDGNFWAGTFYNGLFFSNLQFPFRPVGLPNDVKAIKSLVEDGNGRLWVVTDNFGIYSRTDAGIWTCFPGSEGIKFQGGDYDFRTNSIWMGVYQGGLCRLDLTSGRFKKYGLPPSESVVDVKRKGDILYLAGNAGVYVFDPENEDTVSRMLPGFDGNVSCLDFDLGGNLIAAGNGLRIAGKDSVSVIFSQGLCPDVTVDEDGTIWVAVIGKGLARYRDGTLEWIEIPSKSVNKGVSGVCVAGPDRLLLGSRDGLSLFRPSDRSISSYSHLNGLGDSAASVKTSLVCSDGRILVSGFSALVELDKDCPVFDGLLKTVRIDNLFINGVSRRDLLCGPCIVLGPGETNFRFNLADYDYSHCSESVVRWRLDGYDQEWTMLDNGYNIDYMNMKHGRYTLELETLSGSNADIISVPVVLKPYWYMTVVARVVFLLFAIASVVVVLYSAWSKAVLSEKLRLQEKELEDRIKFFRDLSLELRTPLNLAVGQLEKFFHDYGARTKGVEDLESVYMKSRRMQSLISDFVEKQSENSGVDVVGAHFLNAATAVVERHLFSGDLCVSVLCEELNMGKTKLSQEMKRICGMTPREFIEDIRMKHANEMLHGGRYRVAEVSDRLGFSSPRYFLYRYKVKFGHAPSKAE